MIPTYGQFWIVAAMQIQWITSGIHYVNRICYLVTERAHNGLVVDFRVPHRARCSYTTRAD